MNVCGHALLSDIVSRLITSLLQTSGNADNFANHRDTISSVCIQASSLVESSNAPTVAEFSAFLRIAHDLHIRADTAVRGALMRVVRLSMQSKSHYDALISEEWHYLIVSSLEREQIDREQDYLILERMQALKVIKKSIEIAGSSDSKNSQLAFAQSLIAIASHKGDTLRIVCLEMLRELSVVNPRVVAMGNGFTILMEAIFDESNADMNESLILSFLYVLNDPKSRRYIRPHLDLRTLIAPFTDLEYVENGSIDTYRWKAAKSALVTIMRSWVGVVQMTSDDLGLPTLIRMLRDTKVAAGIQDALLDTIAEIFEPLISKMPNMRFSKRSRYSSNGSRRDGDGNRSGPTVGKAQRTISGSSISSSSTASSSSFSSTTHQFMSASSSFSNMAKHSFSGDSSRKDPGEKGSGMGFSLFSGLFSGTKSSASPVPKSSSSQKRSSGLFSMSSTNKNETNVTFVKSAVPTLPKADVDGVAKSEQRKDVDECDPIYNIMGSYSALLCCAFIHAEIIESLCFLGVHGELKLATKSRALLVEILRTIARIFPEERCAELLTVPSLIEFAAAASEKATANRAHKASQILSALADAFSMVPATMRGESNNVADGKMSVTNSTKPSFSGRNNNELSYNSSGNNGNSSPTSSRSDSQRLSSFTFPNSEALQKSRQVWDLCDEMKWIGQVGGHNKGNGVLSGTQADVVQELRAIMTLTVDKTDFNRQMELSRVVGKEGKEPFKWDWVTIRDMLEYSFQHPDRLLEAMRSKWIKRVSGFYRCSNDEKGFFSNLSWDASNLHYLECACSMYNVLVGDPQGLSFLQSDRRGVLFNVISKEMKEMFDASLGAFKFGGATSSKSQNVFRLAACQATMAREYFTLLGRMTLVDAGRALLDETPLVYTLSLIGTSQPLDYLSRLAITSLAFTDNGYMSQLLIKSWWASGKCSVELRGYTISLLKVLLSARPAAFREWGIDVLVAMLSFESSDTPSPQLVELLMQTVEEKGNLLAFLSKNPVAIITMKGVQKVLTRMVSVPEGVAFLSPSDERDENNLVGLIDSWRATQCKEYVRLTDALMIKTLVLSKAASSSAKSFLQQQALQTAMKPIVLQVKDLADFANPYDSGLDKNTALVSAGTSAASQDSQASSQGSFDASAVNLEGLLRVPWNIEVKLVTQAGFPSAATSLTPEYVKMDCFVDTTEMRSPSCSDVTCDSSRTIKIRAFALDERGIPAGKAISSNRTIMTCLLAGVAPVNREGKMYPMGNKVASSRRKSAAMLRATDMANIVRQSNVVPPTAAEADDPITASFDTPCYDWSVCKPGHRQGKVIELGDNRFSVQVGGEPCTWIFSRVMAGAPVSRSRTGSLGNVFGGSDAASMLSGRAMDSSRSGSNNYLVEVVYHMRIETGQVRTCKHSIHSPADSHSSLNVLFSCFVSRRCATSQAIFGTLPRHLYGELSRNHTGLLVLNNQQIISDLLSSTRRKNDMGSLDLRAALWSLGHIASTDFGYTAITNIEPNFVEWCISGALNHAVYSVRATFFQAIGLLSRSDQGSRKLAGTQWDCSARASCFAVAIPRNPSVLFAKPTDEFNSMLLNQPTHNPSFLHCGSDTDLEVLGLIAKVKRHS